MNVAGYIRVSSEEQTENYSIPEQQDIIESYCKVRSWNLIKCYIDGGYTGANTERPALNEFLEKAGSYDAVVVYKIDRFSRSQKDMLNMIEILKEKGCKFVSVQENFDTSTPLGMLMLGILAAFAQLEREQIKERMSLGRKGRTKKRTVACWLQRANRLRLHRRPSCYPGRRSCSDPEDLRTISEGLDHKCDQRIHARKLH